MEYEDLPRVYFDANDANEAGDYLLIFKPSLADLAAIPGGARAGLHVVIYMTDEVECEAVLHFDLKWNAWVGRPVEGTWKSLDIPPNPA